MKTNLLVFFLYVISVTAYCQPYINSKPVKNLDGKWGFVDLTGKNILIPFEYDYAEMFLGEATVVKKQSKFFLINLFGKVLFENSDTIYYVGGSKNLFFSFKKKNLYGIVDDNGKIIQEPKYSNISIGENAIIIKNNGKWGYWENGFEDFNNIPYFHRPDEPAILIDSCLEFEYKEKRIACNGYTIVKLINEALVYPEEASKNNIEGTVVIQIKIDEKGNVKGTQLIRDIGGGCGDSAKSVVDHINNYVNNKWASPAYHDGAPVPSVFNIPIRFELE